MSKKIRKSVTVHVDEEFEEYVRLGIAESEQDYDWELVGAMMEDLMGMWYDDGFGDGGDYCEAYLILDEKTSLKQK